MNELEKLEKAKQDIQDKIDKLKNPKFEVGKWYRYENRKCFLFCYQGDGVDNYGFNLAGLWATNLGLASIEDGTDTAKPATNEEATQTLPPAQPQRWVTPQGLHAKAP